MTAVLTRCKVPFESLSGSAIAQRYPQFSSHDLGTGILETESGVLMARRAVSEVVESALSLGVEYRQAQVTPPLVGDDSETASTRCYFDQRWRANFGGAICFCLWRVAWKNIP